MRILHVNAHHRRVGGAEVFLHRLLDGQRARGHRIALFAQEADEERHEPELCIVRRAEFDPERLVRDEALARSLCEFATAFRPEILHVHNLHVFPATFPRTLAELGLPALLNPQEFGLLCPNAWCVWPDGTPCAGGPGQKCFEHGCERNYPFDARNVVVARLRLLHCRVLADAVVCASEALAERLRAQGFTDVRVLRYFADPAKFGGLEAIAELRATIPREPDHVLCLGRLQPEKGVGVLLEAWPAVRRARPEARLSIVGEGSERAALERQAQALGSESGVTFHGAVPHEEVPAFLARASVQVLPSIWAENAAQSCNDAMLLGLPLIASRIGGLPEIVRHEESGLLFTPRDPAELAQAIVRVLSEPGLAERLAAGGQRALEEHEREAHLTTLDALYEELRARPRVPLPAALDAELEYALGQMGGLLLEKERAFVAADREARQRGTALDELRAQHPWLRSA